MNADSGELPVQDQASGASRATPNKGGRRSASSLAVMRRPLTEQLHLPDPVGASAGPATLWGISDLSWTEPTARARCTGARHCLVCSWSSGLGREVAGQEGALTNGLIDPKMGTCYSDAGACIQPEHTCLLLEEAR